MKLRVSLGHVVNRSCCCCLGLSGFVAGAGVRGVSGNVRGKGFWSGLLDFRFAVGPSLPIVDYIPLCSTP